MIELRRRSFITGLVALVAAPAVVKAASLMKVAPTEQLIIDTHDMNLAELTRRFLASMDEKGDRLAEQMADAVFANGQQWDGVQGAKIGSQLRIRLPADYIVTDGPMPMDYTDGPGGVATAQAWTDRINTRWIPRAEAEARFPSPVDPALSAVALAMAAPVVIAKVLEQPVTRRFWGLPQHSAADQEG